MFFKNNFNYPPVQQNAVIYCRVSDMKQVRDGVSLELQEKECLELARRKGFNVIKVYKDAGISGRTEFRDGFMQMMADINTNPHVVDVVIFYHLTRLGRRALDVLFTIENLMKLNINILSCRDELDYNTLQGRFTLQLLASLAELESNQIKERVIPAMRYKAEQGGWNGARHIPYGYANVPIEGQQTTPNGRVKKILVPIPEEAEQVRIIFDLYANGLEKDEKLGQHKITKYLIDNGYKYRDGSEWTTRRVASVLQNVDLYAGYIIWGRYRTQYKQKYNPQTRQWEYEFSTIGKNKGKPIIQRILNDDYVVAKGKHEAIISEELYQRVKDIRKTKKPATRKNKGRLPAHLLTGLLLCPDCKTPVIASAESHGLCYKCRVAIASPGVCNYNTIKEEYIIDRVYKVFYPYFELKIFLGIPSLILEKAKYDERINNDKERHFNEIKAKIKTLNEQIADEYVRYHSQAPDKRIPEQAFQMVIQRKTEEVKALENELAELEQEITNINVAQYDLQNVLEELKKYGNVKEFFESLPMQTKIDYFQRIFCHINYQKHEGKQGKKSIKSLEFVINADEIRPPSGFELQAIIDLEKENPRVFDKAFNIEAKLNEFYSLNLLMDIVERIVEVNKEESVKMLYKNTGEERNTGVWEVILNTLKLNQSLFNKDLDFEELKAVYEEVFKNVVIEQ